MAVRVNLDDLGTPLLDKLLSEELLDRAVDVRMRIEHALSTKIHELRQRGCKYVYIVRWHEDDGATFKYLGQVFGPGMSQEAQALAKEKQGTVEIVEFRRGL